MRPKTLAMAGLPVTVGGLCLLFIAGWSPLPTGADGPGAFLAIDAATADNSATRASLASTVRRR